VNLLSLFLIVTLLSPDKKVKVNLNQEPASMALQIVSGQDTVVQSLSMGLELTDGTQVATSSDRIVRTKRRTIRESVEAPFYHRPHFEIAANELTLQLKSGFELQIRAYNEGVAYRFVSRRTHAYNIMSERLECRFGGDPDCWLSYSTNEKNPYAMAFQNFYDATTLTQAAGKLAFLPATIQRQHSKVTLLESNVRHYPGMFVRSDSTGILKAEFAHYPAQMDYYPWRRMSFVSRYEDYIARCEGSTELPWRILALADEDRQMPLNPLVYALSEPNQIGDTDWIRPGKVAWDWWNDWNLTGVDFRTGINMQTYRYYIDFASAYGLEYVILDEGWYDPKAGDMLTVIPELDLEALIAYAEQKRVKLVLWCVFNVLDDQLEEACQKYSQMGISGFKVDFLDRNDQTAVEMAYRIADKCAQYHLMLDYHGFYTPTGMNRAYPNVINYESVFGMEEMKWSPKTVDMPQYDVTFPFIRMQAGPVDYTPGAMRNATRADWNASYSTPISQGTRCHQLATYVVFDSPFTMLCDAPTMYEKEPDYTRFLSSIPTVFDSTIVVMGELGQYIVTARRSAGTWYIAGLTNSSARDFSIPLSFLPAGQHQAVLYHDGVNADRQAQDYQVQRLIIECGHPTSVHLAPGGGFVMKVNN